MKLSRYAQILLLTILTVVGGCDANNTATQQPAAPEVPTIPVVIAGRQFKLEVADDHEERQRGLMFRKSMPIDHGMLFVFPDVDQRGFWMKNTVLPLDIAYLDANGTVLNIEPMYPNDLTSVDSAGPAKYAIELNQGVAKSIGLKPGDRIGLPPTSAK